MRRTRALIVGGGPAGAAAAIGLARAGAAPLLIERETDPRDIVCGAFLGWDAIELLERLGIDPWALGATPIDRVRILAGRRTVEAQLPRRAGGLSRRRLDAALLAAAARAGAAIERGRTVAAMDPVDRSIRLRDGQEIAAEALFLATGKHELRGASRGTTAGAVGMRTTLAGPALARELAGTIELHLFDGGYAGLLLQEDGRANLCLSVDRATMARAGGDRDALLAALGIAHPRLAARLAQGQASSWSAVAGVPYGWRATQGRAGLFRLGDQAAVIASLAGDGIAIALASAASAASAWAAGGGDAAADWQRRFADRARRPLGVAGAAKHLGQSPRWRPPALALLGRVPAVATRIAAWSRIGADG